MGVALLALTALCSITHATEAESTGQANWLGVSVARLSQDFRERTEYRADGVLVTDVAPGSLADQAGIAKGDVLVVVGSVSLRRVDDLARAEPQMETGEPVSVVVARDGGRLIKIMNLESPPVPTPAFDQAQAPEGNGTPEPATSEAPAAPEAAKAPPAPQAVPSPAGPGLLGLRGERLNADFAAALGVPASRGMVVLGVVEGSPAGAAGIRPGDVITRVGDQRIETAEDLGHALAATPGRVSLLVQRQASETVVEVGPGATAAATVPATPESAAGSLGSRDDTWRDQVLLDLRGELRTLRRELEKLRNEVEKLKAE
jgi:S1-C subfamily serine protease